MGRHSSSRKRRGGKRGRGMVSTIALIAGTVLLPIATLSGGGWIAYRHLNTEQINADYCYDRPDQYQMALFVDYSVTHQTSASQQRDLANSLRQAYEAMPVNGKMSVFTTENGASATVNVPVFTSCKPASTSQEQMRIDAPTSSAPKLARVRAEADARFDEWLDDLLTGSRQTQNLAKSSPILEQLQGISRYDFGAPLSKLVAYTDGINNSAAGQFCAVQGHLPPFSRFAAKPDYAFIRPQDFGGAQVDLLLLELGKLPSTNLPYCTTDELRRFWVEYFEANGASTVRLTPLGYGAGG